MNVRYWRKTKITGLSWRPFKACFFQPASYNILFIFQNFLWKLFENRKFDKSYCLLRVSRDDIVYGYFMRVPYLDFLWANFSSFPPNVKWQLDSNLGICDIDFLTFAILSSKFWNLEPFWKDQNQNWKLMKYIKVYPNLSNMP